MKKNFWKKLAITVGLTLSIAFSVSYTFAVHYTINNALDVATNIDFTNAEFSINPTININSNVFND